VKILLLPLMLVITSIFQLEMQRIFN